MGPANLCLSSLCEMGRTARQLPAGDREVTEVPEIDLVTRNEYTAWQQLVLRAYFPGTRLGDTNLRSHRSTALGIACSYVRFISRPDSNLQVSHLGWLAVSVPSSWAAWSKCRSRRRAGRLLLARAYGERMQNLDTGRLNSCQAVGYLNAQV